MSEPNYFFVAVSTRQHLELCLKYAMAGFTNSIAGAWTFVEIQEGDFVSFLYAACAFNLYKVVGKEAIVEFEKMPPWPPVSFRESGKQYLFPFRLYLHPIREFCESLVRPEFSYIAENLLLRSECIGGILIANSFSKSIVRLAPSLNICPVRYNLNLDWNAPRSFPEILASLTFCGA